MNAHEALEESNDAIKEWAKKQKAQKVAEEKALKAKISKALKTEVPFIIKKIDGKITEATKKGKKSITWSFSDDDISYEVRQKVKEILEGRDFIICEEWYSYEDPNFESKVERTGFKMIVCWDK